MLLSTMILKTSAHLKRKFCPIGSQFIMSRKIRPGDIKKNYFGWNKFMHNGTWTSNFGAGTIV